MVRGIERFREYFAEHQDAWAIIGGVACEFWFAARNLSFRRTDDIDAVLIVEALDAGFTRRFWDFVRDGGYVVEGHAEEVTRLYRFVKPRSDGFPAMVELFTRKPENIDLEEGQQIVPLRTSELSSLSAILVDDDYYRLIVENREVHDDLPVITAVAMVPLKARAWLGMRARRERGEQVDSRDLKKHRNDVFRLALTLPSAAGPAVPDRIRDDLRLFLSEFREGSGDWPATRASLKGASGGLLPSTGDILEVLAGYFRL